ncbi:pyridoxamine 5'-phosphate oxidase family protein [Candidatus Omnitrophota bacterium]
MMNEQTLTAAINTLLQAQHFGVLATQGNEHPYCTLVSYVHTDDLKNIIFATIRSARKYHNLKQNSHVSLLVGSQTNKIDDIKDAEALTIIGAAAEVPSEDYGKARGIYLKKHPYLEDFITMPDCALVRVAVDKYILVRNFQDVMEYIVS